MGVKNLMKIINKYSPQSVKLTNISDYKDKILGIDAHLLIYKMIKSEDYETGSNGWKHARMLEERRGVCANYLGDKARQSLVDKGYSEHVFENKKRETFSVLHAKDVVENLRKKGHFARIVVNPCYNIRGGQAYAVWFKEKFNKLKLNR